MLENYNTFVFYPQYIFIASSPLRLPCVTQRQLTAAKLPQMALLIYINTNKVYTNHF